MNDSYNAGNDELKSIFENVKKSIEKESFVEAIIYMRTIAHYMAKWLVYDAGLWDQARRDDNGKQWKEPSFERCINTLRSYSRIDAKTRHIFDDIRNDGNFGAHEIKTTRDEVDYNFKNLQEYYLVFSEKFPEADRLSHQPNKKSFKNTSRKTKQKSRSMEKKKIPDNITPKPKASDDQFYHDEQIALSPEDEDVILRRIFYKEVFGEDME